MSSFSYKPRTGASIPLVIFGIVLFVICWLIATAAGLAVPALAIWALLHFAFHVV